jgi:N-acylneuraminate cytidylyltransferase
MNVVAFIFARGGSKGLPGKNVKNFCGKPLLTWSIEQARSLDLFSEVIVSTDCTQIADVATKYGASVPFIRPSNLATDDSPELLSWKHAINQYELIYKRPIDLFVSLPATSPLRSDDDIVRSIDLMKSNIDICDGIINVVESNHNPYFNMVKFDTGQLISLFCSGKAVTRRQDAPKCFNITTVCYCFKSEYLKSTNFILSDKVIANV